MNLAARVLFSTVLVATLLPAPAHADLPPLIPREALLGNPERTRPQISPDGKRLAWLAPDAQGVLQVWVQTLGKSDARTVTADARRPILEYRFAEDDRTLLYLQDQAGDENTHVYGVDLVSGNVRDLTPWQGVKAGLLATEAKFPHTLLVTLNLRKRELMDVYRIDLDSGAAVLDTENPGDVQGWTADAKLQVRAATALLPDSSTEIRVREGGKWHVLVRGTPEDELEPIDFSADGATLYLRSTVGVDTSRVMARQLKSGKETVLAAADGVDADDVVVQPQRHVVQAVNFPVGRTTWKVVDPSISADFAALAQVAEGDFDIASRDRADTTWIVRDLRDRGSVRYFTYDRKAHKATLLFVSRPKLDSYRLAAMQAIELKARDGLLLHGYLTLPEGVPAKALPLVLFVHGGPWARDGWGYHPWVQLLANRGYAVLQVNYRGSTGFGKKFLHAADKQWGKKMHDDLLDSVAWAVAQGYADARRVAIFGGSYGGYAALAGAAFTPDAFRCAVDLVGPSSLFTFIAAVPPYWKPLLQIIYTRVGHPEHDKQLLTEASPLYAADRIKIPLLILQGANDPRVKQAESEQIVDAIAKRKGRVTYVVYPDEGHGFARPENNMDFLARTEAFLAEHLGGRAEKLVGERIPGSTAIVKVIGGRK
jgi:dipeptidyl aminopeptidase/acylaminoacyl peptidase